MCFCASDPAQYRQRSSRRAEHGSDVFGNVRSAQQGAGQDPHGSAATGTFPTQVVYFQSPENVSLRNKSMQF